MAEERIQKILAQAGYGSRRSCELFIQAGRVTVNGRVAVLGEKADPARDKILVDLKPVKKPPEHVYVALHKPRQVLSAIHQDDDRPDVLQYVPIQVNLFPVGRLDYDSEGLILLTNDGDFSNQLTHPRYGHEKEYIVQVGSRPDGSQLDTWRRGVVLEDGYRTAPARVDLIDTTPNGATLKIVMHEGRKRQIREVGGTIGLPVLRIKRVRIGIIQLGTLRPGEWRYLSESEVRQTLKKSTPVRRSTPRPMKPVSPRKAYSRKLDANSKDSTAKPATRAPREKTATRRSVTPKTNLEKPKRSSPQRRTGLTQKKDRSS